MKTNVYNRSLEVVTLAKEQFDEAAKRFRKCPSASNFIALENAMVYLQNVRGSK